MTLISANDAFTNPDSPWYYVVGAAFLLLIVAALVIYMLVSRKKRAEREEKDLFQADNAEQISDTQPPEDSSAEVNAETRQKGELLEEQNDQEPAATEEEYDAVRQEPVTEEPQIEPVSNEKDGDEQAEAASSEGAEEAGSKPQAEKAPQKLTTKRAQKPFIDRLIAEKSVHAVYNELKNTILSYPGIKAKLCKDGEEFVFAAETKAEIKLDGKEITLYLAVEQDAVPPQFGTEQADGALKTKLAVKESAIDEAQKLIMFAMNISMLTRNDRHRRVDYVQNAVNAKNRAKAKQTAAKSKK